jgi:hypothetical protein
MPPKAAAEDETAPAEVKGIKMSEVEKHSSVDDLWLVIDGASARSIARPPPREPRKRDVSRFDLSRRASSSARCDSLASLPLTLSSSCPPS